MYNFVVYLTILYSQSQNRLLNSNGNHAGLADLVDVCLTGGVYSLLQFGCVDFDVLAESLAGLGQVQAGFWRPVNDHQLSGLHLINNLLNGVTVRATFIVYVRYSGSVGGMKAELRLLISLICRALLNTS